MNRAVFIILVVTMVAIAILSPIWKKSQPEEHTLSVNGLQCLGGTYKAVMPYRGDEVQRLVLVESSAPVNLSISKKNGAYAVHYSVLEPTPPVLRQADMPYEAAVLDTKVGLRRVYYSGTLADLARQILAGETPPITLTN